MPRYYFHLTDGTQELGNARGLDLPGNAAARDEAVVFAHELRDGKAMPGRNWDDWFVEIKDAHGHLVDRIPIASVPGRPVAM
jgi:hypothetical protein